MEDRPPEIPSAKKKSEDQAESLTPFDRIVAHLIHWLAGHLAARLSSGLTGRLFEPQADQHAWRHLAAHENGIRHPD